MGRAGSGSVSGLHGDWGKVAVKALAMTAHSLKGRQSTVLRGSTNTSRGGERR